MKPAVVTLRVLYLFAGEDRQADLGECIQSALVTLNASLLHHEVQLAITNVDTKRGGLDHNLLDQNRQDSFLSKILAQDFDVVLVTPSCNKHSRAVFANRNGPAPVRDFHHPRGFPNNTPTMQKEADESDALLDFSVRALEAAADAAERAEGWRTTRAWFEFPEDLGEALGGTPASAWQRTDLQALSSRGFSRGALFQCEWAEVNYAKPTGTISDIPQFNSHPLLYLGWPSFIKGKLSDGRPTERLYNGPLPRGCSHGGHPGLIGRGPGGGHKTGPTGTYPAGLCEKLAQSIVDDFATRLTSRATPAGRRTPLEPQDHSSIPLVSAGKSISVYGPVPPSFREEALAIISGFKLGDSSSAKGSSACYGLTTAGKAVLVRDPAEADRLALPSLNTLLSKVLKAANLQCMWSTLKICQDTSAEWHADADTIGPIIIWSIAGSNSRLEIQGEGEHNTAGMLTLLDGKREHRTTPEPPGKLAIVAFRPEAWFAASPKEKGRLKALGFQIEEAAAIVPPERIPFRPELAGKLGVEYIGRGSPQHSISPSIWGNPFKISPTCSRAEVVKSFAKHLSDSQELRAQIPTLEGKRIMCHCRLDEQCHGDSIIEEFAAQAKAALQQHLRPPLSDNQLRANAKARKAEAALKQTPSKKIRPQAATVQAGVGNPIFVKSRGSHRLLYDGAGLCSPGLWPPERRKPDTPGAQVFAKTLQQELDLLGEKQTAKLFADLAGSKLSADPFPEAGTARILACLTGIADQGYLQSPPKGEPQKQPIRVRLIGALLHAFGDPDAPIFLQYECGVPLGVGKDLPRTPLVFPEKLKWSLKEQETWGGNSEKSKTYSGIIRGNYPSAEKFAAELMRDLDDQAVRDQVLVLSEAVAKQRYGKRLTVASLAAIEKAVHDDGTVEIRILTDGSNGVETNQYIKVRDAVPLPLADDIRTTTRLQGESGKPHFGLTVDVREAHRLIVVAPEDWPLQAVQPVPGGNVYLNKRGTYGYSSAAYWWGRLAAGVQRLTHYLLAHSLAVWLMLFADDFNAAASGQDFRKRLLAIPWIMTALGVPLSWAKTKGGFVYTWIGYEIDLRGWTLGISATRADWVIKWTTEVLVANCILIGDLNQALGRLVFVYGALVWDRPFLAPLFTFAAVHNDTATPTLPVYVRLVIHWIRERIQARRAHPCLVDRTAKGNILRVDAKAEGTAIALGGWLPKKRADGSIDKWGSKWFSTELQPAEAPWAFVNGRPCGVISTLELLATLVGIVALDPLAGSESNIRGTVLVTGFTDSMVSSNIVAKAMTTAFPLCCVSMELSAQLERRNAVMDLDWVPRDSNAEADALADGRTEGFNPDLRVEAHPEKLQWLVLPELFKLGLEFHSSAAQKRAGPSNESEGPRSKAKGSKLRDRQPW